MSAETREATNDDSTGSRRSRTRPKGGLQRLVEGSPTGRLALTAVAVVAILLLIVSEFLPLYNVVIGELETQRRSESGWRNHAFAMLLLGLASIPMLLGALRGAKPAMYALGGIGVVVLIIALTVDLPAARETGTLRESIAYEDAKAEPAIGFFLETLGGVLLLLVGGLLLLTAPARAKDEPRSRPRRRDAI